MTDHGPPICEIAEARTCHSGPRLDTQKPGLCASILEEYADDSINCGLHSHALQRIAQVAWRYPNLPIVITPNAIQVPCPTESGFSMCVQFCASKYVVYFAEWSTTVNTITEALDLLNAALRGKIRIRSDIGFNDTCWRAELCSPDGIWQPLILSNDSIEVREPPSPARAVYLQNDFSKFT